MTAEIRKYHDVDRAGLIASITGLQAYISSLDDLKRERLPADFDADRYVQKLLEKVKAHHGVICLADDGGKLIGCIAGIIPENTQDDDLEAYPSKDGRILELYVQSGHRSQMIGLRLMQAMEQYFKDAGCVGCHVDCFVPNVDAHKFYLKLGYIDRMTALLKLF